MKKNNLLNKPIVLSLLLFLFSYIMAFVFPKSNNLSIFCLKSITISFVLALLLGLFQEKLKITLDKINKIKIAVYYSMIYIILCIPIAAFFSYPDPLKVIFLTSLLFFCIYFTLGLFLYLGLFLGDKLRLFKNGK